jgi:hypothetical protein
MPSSYRITGKANPGGCKWGKNRIFVKKELYFGGGVEDQQVEAHRQSQIGSACDRFSLTVRSAR